MTEIMLNLEVLKKFHEELPRVVGVNITIEEFQVPILLIPFRTCFGWFNGTKYFGTELFWHVVLRLHPAAHYNFLGAQHNLAMWVVTLYQKMLIFFFFFNVWAMHRDPDFWNNPSEFRAERFLGHAIILENLCERMLMHVLASLLHLLEWKLPNGTKLNSSENLGIVLKKSTPLRAMCYSNLELYA